MKTLAVIPARSGSKGLPDKNIRPLLGKPLMAYSIEAAITSEIFDEVMVSTDSHSYADIAEKFGASVPFLRSEENSGDSAGSWDTVNEVLERYHSIGKNFDAVCLLQPTSPLRSSEDISNAYKLFVDKASVGVISVCELEHTLTLANTLPEDMSLVDFIQKEKVSRRQEAKTLYRVNGAIYFVNIKELINDSYLYRAGSYAYVMPIDRSIDIDSLYDFELAEFFLERRQKK